MDQVIQLSRTDGVATITLNRPEKKNALSPADFARLGSRLGEVAANPEDRVLISRSPTRNLVTHELVSRA